MPRYKEATPSRMSLSMLNAWRLSCGYGCRRWHVKFSEELHGLGRIRARVCAVIGI